MARISTYAIDATPEYGDKVIGTNSTGDVTKNFTFGGIAGWINSDSAIGIVGQSNYMFQADERAGREVGTISFPAFEGAGTEFSAITTLVFSDSTRAGSTMTTYLLTLVGKYVILADLASLNSFGIYKLTAFTPRAGETGFYDASLTLIEANNSILAEHIYGYATYDITETSDTPTLQTVTDAGNTTTNAIVVDGIEITRRDSTPYPENLGQQMIAIGNDAASIFSGDSPIMAIGDEALKSATNTAIENIAIGSGAMKFTTTATYGVGIGLAAGYRNNGTQNSYIGPYAGPFYSEVTGGFNTMIGSITGLNTSGNSNRNTAIGANSFYNATESGENTIIGATSGFNLTVGSGNTIIGHSAGAGITTGSGNVIIGRVTGLAPDLTNTMILATGLNQTRILIDSTGNVGIGTTAPTDKLEVVSNDNVGPTKIVSAVSLSGSQRTSLGYNSVMGSHSLKLEAQANNLDLSTKTAYPIIFNTNNTEVARITDAGKVGIGTTAPSEKLHITGGGTGNIRLDAGGTYYGTNIQAISNAGLKIGNDDFTGYAFFADDGKVGVGTTVPSQELHIDGNTLISAEKYYFVAGTNGGYGSDHLGNFKIKQNGSDLIFGFGDNVGIGTTAPSVRLVVDEPTTNNLTVAQFKHQQSSVTSNVVFENSAGADNTGFSLNFKTGAGGGLGGVLGVIRTNNPIAGAADMFLSSSGGEAVRITSDGNVGIGTTAPNSKVHISGTAMEQLRMETSGGPTAASDTSGRVGDMAYDDNYFYIKTNNGWGRMALDFGF